MISEIRTTCTSERL